jgi:hypothetical protein
VIGEDRKGVRGSRLIRFSRKKINEFIRGARNASEFPLICAPAQQLPGVIHRRLRHGNSDLSRLIHEKYSGESVRLASAGGDHVQSAQF